MNATWSPIAVLVLAAAIGAGCGRNSKRPDTGYGANQPVPAVRTCAIICERLADCAAALCNEDTMSTRYTAEAEALAADCVLGCDELGLQYGFSPSEWECMFQASCREFLDYERCTHEAHYTCDLAQDD